MNRLKRNKGAGTARVLAGLLTAALILSAFSACGKGGDDRKADAVWRNGVVYTADKDDTVVEAVAVKDGKIIFAGTAKDAEQWTGPDTKIHDLEGKMMIPGMTDSHIHPPGAMIAELFRINLNGTLHEEETMKIIRDYVKAHPDKEVYYGEGFSAGAFSGEEVSKGPKKERLDEITDKPVIITSYDGHTAWLNSAGFRYCGIDENTVPPAGGIIEKTKDGKLWGTLKELAQDLIKPQEFTEKEVWEGYKAFFEKQKSYGFTGITSMSAGIGSGNIKEPFREMDEKGELEMYVFANTVIDPNKNYRDQIDAAAAKRDEYASDLLEYGSLKFFADGVVEGVTACLLAPYAAGAKADSGFAGDPLWSRETMQDAFSYALSKDLQLHVHAIGDAAARQTLDALAFAQEKNPDKDYRNVITHLQLVDPADLPRFGELKVIACVQPYWAFKEPLWWEIVDLPVLGGARAEKEYPIKSLVDAGAVLTISSDHPVTPENNPFLAIEAGVTRNLNDPDLYGVPEIKNMDDPKWLLWPEERVSVETMLRACTINGAYQNFRDDRSGSIEKGKSADFVVLDQNLFEIDPVDISETKVLSTIFRGKEVYRAGKEKKTEKADSN